MFLSLRLPLLRRMLRFFHGKDDCMRILALDLMDGLDKI